MEKTTKPKRKLHNLIIIIKSLIALNIHLFGSSDLKKTEILEFCSRLGETKAFKIKDKEKIQD